jgi:hypothetical protein
MRETQSQFPETLASRGVGWQAAGFTLTGIACLVILKLFEGSDYWLYQWFEKAAVDLYWSFIVPLAFLFDWVRKMFESAKAIREAKKAQIREKATQEGLRQGLEQGLEQGVEQGIEQGLQQGLQQGSQEENQRIRELLERHGVTLPPEVAEAIFSSPKNAP